jgi:hypothetical protein
MTFYNTSNPAIQTEVRVRKFLNAKEATVTENRDLDIDYYIDATSVSFKTQPTAKHTGNIAIELTNTLPDGSHQPAWWFTGKADVYHFLIGDVLLQTTKTKLTNYIETNKFKAVVQLSAKLAQIQEATGHPHRQSTVGLLDVQDLINSRVLIKLAVIPERQKPNKPVKKHDNS